MRQQYTTEGSTVSKQQPKYNRKAYTQPNNSKQQKNKHVIFINNQKVLHFKTIQRRGNDYICLFSYMVAERVY